MERGRVIEGWKSGDGEGEGVIEGWKSGHSPPIIRIPYWAGGGGCCGLALYKWIILYTYMEHRANHRWGASGRLHTCEDNPGNFGDKSRKPPQSSSIYLLLFLTLKIP